MHMAGDPFPESDTKAIVLWTRHDGGDLLGGLGTFGVQESRSQLLADGKPVALE